ncbi:MAG TPA: copper resistance protein CopC [Rhizomicrobium sp.]|jgi:methionine-rich copper-binding protein CopC|nr:copper resistance protein CopC [Rhizomicrobium sp.]
MKTAALLFLLASAAPALAHPALEKAMPAANASVKAPKLISMQFSERLEPAFSGAALADASGKTVPVSASVGGSTITLIPFNLKPGAYKVSWHGVGRDTHRVSGSFGFKVVP